MCNMIGPTPPPVFALRAANGETLRYGANTPDEDDE
jgi:hypothetical protein